MSKPTMWVANHDVNLLSAPQRVSGTNHFFIGTMKPGGHVIYSDCDGTSSGFCVEEGARLYATGKALKKPFIEGTTVQEAFDCLVEMVNEDPDDGVLIDITLELSLPALFKRYVKTKGAFGAPDHAL